MEVHLGGHLAFYDPEKRSRIEVHLEGETALLDLVRELGVPEAEIALAAVNRTVVSLSEARVNDGDRLDLYPPMSGGAWGVSVASERRASRIQPRKRRVRSAISAPSRRATTSAG
jgi:sulfur carrier protein ThiS